MIDYLAERASLREVARIFAHYGWVMGTAGNFSAVVGRDPLRLLLTISGLDKGALSDTDFVTVNDRGQVVEGEGRPSAEAGIHLELVGRRGVGSVVHTHSVWANVVSRLHGDLGGVTLADQEMLKGLSGVTTHQHREWLPIVDNDQDYGVLRLRIGELLRSEPRCHGFILRHHGLYTWGTNVAEARRHAEILEYLLEIEGRTFCR
jgi:methylthioribulose-1-phosphate dehydratase